ncbi:hypothetical protein J0910_15445 [Nocardiopsis sp. CNT-189]|uniref:PspA/IM30 family protein n=1 Tax=Nocardiopsis oceanisediminis TaxID=2816862 RepID=UPI003B316450
MLLATAAMLGVSGDYAGTLEGGAWYQRGWMLLFALAIFAAHIAVELFNTREDRRMDRALEDARDDLAEAREELDRLRGEKKRLERDVDGLRGKAAAHLIRIQEAKKDSDDLAWLAGPQGRQALQGLQEFAERVLDTPAPDGAGPAAGPRGAGPGPARRGVPPVALQLATGLLVALLAGAALLGIEIFLD